MWGGIRECACNQDYTPPKSGNKKLSKAEKDKLKKDELEKKAQEEEEARIQAEEEEEEQKERAKVEAEERRRLDNEERKRRKGQLEDLATMWESYTATLAAEKADYRRQAKWDRYMLCDGSPNPAIPGEINTFMNLWREDQNNNDIESVLKDSKLTLKLLNELHTLIETTPEEELPEKEVNQYKETIKELQSLLAEKLDLSSHILLLSSTDLADPETGNLQTVKTDGVITLSMWGNLSKNPRIKSHEFEEKGFMFEMPKMLTLMDCAVRVLFTEYDHYSEHSKSSVCRPKVNVIEEPEVAAVEGEEEGEEKVEGMEGGDEENKEEAAEGEDPISREETKDVMAALNQLEDNDKEKEEQEVEPVEAEPEEDDFEIKTPEPEEFEDFDGDDDAVDLRAFSVMGGIFHFNLLHLPPQPKTVQSWILTRVDPMQLRPIEYVADANPLTASAAAAGKESPATESTKDGGSLGGESRADKRDVDRPPIGVTMRLPETVYFCEEPQVARWDEEIKQWRLDGFSDHKFNEDKRLLSFRTTQFGTMALIQDTHINMPFQSWEIRPRGLNHCVMTIIAAIVEVEIQIKNDVCCLTQPDKPEVQHLLNQWYPPREFIKRMRAAGLNVFPEPDSSKYVSIQAKNAITEERLYQQMAMTASGMAFSWSKWNSEVGDKERIILQGCEQLQDEALFEEDWSLFMVNKKRTTKLKMTEFDDNFSEDHAEGTEFHADLYHMTVEMASDGAKDRIRETTHTFIDSVWSILRSTKLVTYS
ncbi:hypothetical protein CAPTEDRAFT_227810 [Capitella teleta]|uniref:IC97/Casc1 N-terminal domain-containing protein n=1 Tax=Capitella teleta TaxID=283909 RepID=R7VCX3_CAPTE|nr:hypothetical protein CAPTEDRAFT_227810 [Capitella teleta]|eukprot:ELU16422.1 hypothetical protein CAPTEDRAFT_227810 [Capitella teleta]